jgi:hypothetical protein
MSLRSLVSSLATAIALSWCGDSPKPELWVGAKTIRECIVTVGQRVEASIGIPQVQVGDTVTIIRDKVNKSVLVYSGKQNLESPDKEALVYTIKWKPAVAQHYSDPLKHEEFCSTTIQEKNIVAQS